VPFFKIRFINSDDFVGRAIDWTTNSLWDHAEIETDEGTYIGAHAGSGVEERAAEYCKPSRERRYAIPVTADQHARMMAFARSKIGTPYNYLDIAGLFLHDRRLNSGHRAICSVFVFDAAIAADFYLLNVLPGFTYLITPETLHLSPLLIGRCTYSGPNKEPNT
jgi:hypothetical protein